MGLGLGLGLDNNQTIEMKHRNNNDSAVTMAMLAILAAVFRLSFFVFLTLFSVVISNTNKSISTRQRHRNMNLSDKIKSLVSDCPADSENVLFCFYLPTEQWEKVMQFNLDRKLNFFAKMSRPWDDRPEFLPLLAVYSVAFMVGFI